MTTGRINQITISSGGGDEPLPTLRPFRPKPEEKHRVSLYEIDKDTDESRRVPLGIAETIRPIKSHHMLPDSVFT